MCQVIDLTEICGAIAAGVAKLYLAEEKHITTYPVANATTHTLVGSFTMATAQGWHNIPFVPEEAGLVDELVGSLAGGGFKKTIPLGIAKYSPESNRFVNELLGPKLVGIVVDNNGQMIVVGNKTSSLRLQKAKGGTGKKSTDTNGWELELVCDFAVPCYFYTGAIDTIF